MRTKFENPRKVRKVAMNFDRNQNGDPTLCFEMAECVLMQEVNRKGGRVTLKLTTQTYGPFHSAFTFRHVFSETARPIVVKFCMYSEGHRILGSVFLSFKKMSM